MAKWAAWRCSVVMAEVVTMGATAAERAIVSTEARGTALILDGRLSKGLPTKNDIWA